MTTTGRLRRQPVQGRSRQTVARILDAAAELIDEEGVEAATTRAIADRAGVSYPSLYRFFTDREEILGRLLERHLAELDAFATIERTWQISSVEDLINRELDLHVAYFQQHPSAVRLWLTGRSSQTVVAHVRRRNRPLAKRAYDILVAQSLIPAHTDQQVLMLMVEFADTIMEVAFRDRSDPDLHIIELGRIALHAYARDALPPPPVKDPGGPISDYRNMTSNEARPSH
jgi:AcrR family transcriptional regulator